MSEDNCISPKTVTYLLVSVDVGNQFENFKKIQIYVLVTILVLLLQLVYLIKPFAYRFFRILSWLSYLLVPVLISYVFGLMSQQGKTAIPKGVTRTMYYYPQPVEPLQYLTCVWSTFLLFAYAGFDNLNALSLEERYGRSKLLVQIGFQFTLLLLFMVKLRLAFMSLPLLFAFLILAIKFAGRMIALAHSAGATPRIKNDVTRIIDYMNNQEDVGDDAIPTDLVRTAGFNYLVGPNYTKIEGDKIVEGITMEKIWGSHGTLLDSSSEHNMELKNTCLSFALFWLLLGKFWSYPLYDANNKSSSSSFRAKAWRLVRHGLLAEKGSHEKLFRVIEIELAFLHDFFHARYIFFYLNGFYWKVINIIALPILFWWFIKRSIDYEDLEYLRSTTDAANYSFVGPANTTVIVAIVAVEVIQVVVLLFSRWLKITFLCFYVEKMESKNTWPLSRLFLEVLRFVFLGSSLTSNSSWKRELDQYSLIQSHSTLSKPTSNLILQCISIVGLPFSKPGWKQGKKVALSREVKEAVVLCLQQYDACPKFSNGAQSLRQNDVMKILPDWACNLNNDGEMILVWHIATSVSELHHNPSSPQSSKCMKVATYLSKYCAYLLFFAPSLLPIPALLAEKICDSVIKETLLLFKKPFCGCGKEENAVKYGKLMDLISVADEEAEDKERGKSMLKKGAKLGSVLVTQMDGEKRWKVLANFWAEMILYLAPSNNNELAHVGKLSQGGEFITHLWAVLIHAGIYDRDDMDTTFQQPNTQ